MPLYYLRKSHRIEKKWVIITPDKKTIHFGASEYEDYTIHKDPKRKERYIKRHSAIKKKDGSLAIEDINSPAFWSLYLLWNKPTLEESIRDIKKRFGIHIIKLKE